jgi:hypothetical protein
LTAFAAVVLERPSIGRAGALRVRVVAELEEEAGDRVVADVETLTNP